jgi:ubiquitin carboxyl-terminal hydrolase 14
MATVIKVKWNKEEFDVTIEPESSVEMFKTQMWTLTYVPVDRQKFLGFPGGMLKDSDDLGAKVAKLKPGQKITMMGTAEGGELKPPEEKVVFEEDLTPEEKAKLLKAKKVELIPSGIKNLGNTCYMNATLQCMHAIKDLREALVEYSAPSAAERDVDAVLTHQCKTVSQQLENSVEAVMPLQFVMALHKKFPRFAEMQNGSYMQQDADECLRGLLSVLAGTLKCGEENKVDHLFGYKLVSKLKCLECDEEPETVIKDQQRVMLCHLGTPTDPVSHLHQGVQLSLKEHIEKNSAILGRNAQYEKTSSIESCPPYLVVQFARFGYKSANEWAGTSASRVKLTRKIAFSNTFDIFDCASDELKASLRVGRIRKKELDDKKLEEERAKFRKGDVTNEDKDVEMKPANEDVEMQAALQEYETGYYELVAMVSHKGRTADGGHYVAWCLQTRADGKDVKEDRWACFDDDTVSMHDWKDLVGAGVDLQGGKADTQIAYLSFYKKVTVKDAGNVLGTKEDSEATPAAGAPAEGTAAAPASSS